MGVGLQQECLFSPLTLYSLDLHQGFSNFFLLRLHFKKVFYYATPLLDSLDQCFSNFFIPLSPFHSRHIVFAPQAK